MVLCARVTILSLERLRMAAGLPFGETALYAHVLVPPVDRCGLGVNPLMNALKYFEIV